MDFRSPSCSCFRRGIFSLARLMAIEELYEIKSETIRLISSNLIRLLDRFHRDKPKGKGGIPTLNLSLVLHQFTKPPFVPLRKASLKHLTLKTVFLLTLGSGKRSEIHAWLHKNIRHQGDWSNVSLFPSPGF